MAALERRLTAALGVEAARALSVAERAFSDALGPPVAGRLEHLPTIRQLLWVLARLDRYCTFDLAPQPGSGLDILQGQLEGTARRFEWGELDVLPRHLGYFLPGLRAEARRWKHQTAPQVKDQRIREGRRAGRRRPGRPGRGPAIGYDPRQRRRRHHQDGGRGQ